MTENIETNVPSVYLSDLEKLIERIKKNIQTEDTEISFEFIIASLFPTSWNNIQSALNYQYTQGYMQGYKDKELEQAETRRSESDCYCE